MSVKSQSLYEMYQTILRTNGQFAADDWMMNNLSDEEIRLLENEIEKQEEKVEVA